MSELPELKGSDVTINKMFEEANNSIKKKQGEIMEEIMVLYSAVENYKKETLEMIEDKTKSLDKI